MKAIWNETIIAESEDTVVVEGNHYFPRSTVKQECIEASETTSMCPWKGTANYYTIIAGDKKNRDAAWYYANPKSEAQNIEGRVAFWKGVEVVE